MIKGKKNMGDLITENLYKLGFIMPEPPDIFKTPKCLIERSEPTIKFQKRFYSRESATINLNNLNKLPIILISNIIDYL